MGPRGDGDAGSHACVVFFMLSVSRLLVLAVPAAVIGSYSVAIHAFSQAWCRRCWSRRPRSSAGQGGGKASPGTPGTRSPTVLFAVRWIAVAGGGRSWRRALAGLVGLVLAQEAFGVPVDERAHHYGFDPQVGLLLCGWALVLPAAVW